MRHDNGPPPAEIAPRTYDELIGRRKAGTPNKVTAACQGAVAATGKTPLDVMLDNMRWADKGAAELLTMLTEKGAKLPDGFILVRELMRLRELAQRCARDAAPYVHPRLSPVEQGADEDKPINSVVRIEFVRAKDGRPA